jgi:MlaC protein
VRLPVWMRHRAADFGRRLVLAQALVNDLPQQVVVRPGEIFDISAIYADRFDSYAGQQLQVTGEHPAAAGVMVRSQIVKANGELVKVDYMMRRDGNSWLISDIYLDGAISELATRHSEFAAILKSQGIVVAPALCCSVRSPLIAGAQEFVKGASAPCAGDSAAATGLG